MRKLLVGFGSILLSIFIAWAGNVLARTEVLDFISEEFQPKHECPVPVNRSAPAIPEVPQKEAATPEGAGDGESSPAQNPGCQDCGEGDAQEGAGDGDRVVDTEQSNSSDSPSPPDSRIESAVESAPAPKSGAPLASPGDAVTVPVIRPPPTLVPIYQPKPSYPRLAQSLRISGNVVLSVGVAPDGTVQFVNGKGNPILASEAERTVREWRYQSYSRTDGDNLVWTTVLIEFEP